MMRRKTGNLTQNSKIDQFLFTLPQFTVLHNRAFVSTKLPIVLKRINSIWFLEVSLFKINTHHKILDYKKYFYMCNSRFMMTFTTSFISKQHISKSSLSFVLYRLQKPQTEHRENTFHFMMFSWRA